MTMIESTVAESVLSALRAWHRAMSEPDSPVKSWPTPDEVADVAGLDRAQVVSELGRWKALVRYMDHEMKPPSDSHSGLMVELMARSAAQLATTWGSRRRLVVCS